MSFAHTQTAQIFELRAMGVQNRAFTNYMIEYRKALITNEFDTKGWLEKYGKYKDIRREILENEGFRKGLRGEAAQALKAPILKIYQAFLNKNIYLARHLLHECKTQLQACKWLCSKGHQLHEIVETNPQEVQDRLLEALIIQADKPLKDNDELSFIINPSSTY